MKYKLANGEVVEAPEDLTPEESSWIKQQGGAPMTGKLADAGKSLVSGLGEGAVRAPFLMGDLAHLGQTFGHKVLPETIPSPGSASMSDQVLQAIQGLPIIASEAARKAGFPRVAQKARDANDWLAQNGLLHNPETQLGRYANSAGNAVGGMVLGGSGAFKPTVSLRAAEGGGQIAKALAKRMATSPTAQAAGVGMAGEFAGDVSRGFDETQAQSPLARFMGSAGAGVAAALATFLNKRTAARPLHEVFKDSDPAAFNQARAETNRLQAAGTTQNTVGDSFAMSNPQVGAMEREVSNEMGAGALGRKLTERVRGDIPNLEAQSLNAINQRIVPNAAPPSGRFPTAQEDLLQQARLARTAATSAREQAAPLVPRQDIAGIVRALRAQGRAPGNAQTVDQAYMDQMASILRGGKQYPLPQAPAAPIPPAGAVPTTVTPLGGQAGTAAPIMGVPAIGGPLALPAPQTRAMTQPTPAVGTAVGPRILDPADFGMGPKPMPPFRPVGDPGITDVSMPQPPAPRVPTGFNVVELSKRIRALKTTAPKGAAALDNVSAADKDIIRAQGEAIRRARDELAARSPGFAAGQQVYQDMSPGVETLKVLSTNPQVLQANPSVRPHPAREALISHLSRVDQNLAGQVGERMHAGDILSMNTAQHGKQGLQGELGQTGAATAAAPWYAAYKALSTSGRRSANEDIARLLANPTEANMRILEELARNNPGLARSLTRQGLMGATSATTQTTGSQP